jgi:EmrB/QacA subfamily drug resistance transporter
MSTSSDLIQRATPRADLDPRRWFVLGVVIIAQLMVVLDASIVTIALPSAQRSLHISVANRQWVITAYTLAFGGLLLLGGRVADYQGRKRMFIVGLLGFAAASAFGGLAVDQEMLFAARALQGSMAALMAPAALSILTITFQSDPRERAKAFAAYGAVSGAGGAIGVLAGGLLTQFASWRWCLLVNVPIAVLAAVAAVRIVRESRASGTTRYDVPGALLATGGLVSLVYGFTKAETDGWGSTTTITLLTVAGVLLVAFVVLESRSSHPLLPLRVALDRNRGGAYLTALLTGAGLFAMFVFLSYYLQGVLGYSALKAGVAFLPFAAGIVVAAGLSSSLVPRVGPRLPTTLGLLLGAIGLAWLTRIGVHTSYWTHVLPQQILMSFGLGLAFPPLSSLALARVRDRDAGVASALLNTSQQVGGSLGTALLNTIAASATAAYIADHGRSAAQAGVVHGFAIAFAVGAVLLAVAAITSALFVNVRRSEMATVGAPVGPPAPAPSPASA